MTETERLFSLDKPSLHALSYALRHPDTWPAHFSWNFKHCNSCAMGLAHSLWGQIPEHQKSRDTNGGASKMAKAFGMPFSEAKSIFFAIGGKWYPIIEETKGHLWWKKTYRKIDHENITPEMVADQIDAYLAKAE